MEFIEKMEYAMFTTETLFSAFWQAAKMIFSIAVSSPMTYVVIALVVFSAFINHKLAQRNRIRAEIERKRMLEEKTKYLLDELEKRSALTAPKRTVNRTQSVDGT